MADRMYRPEVDENTGEFPVQDVGHLVSMGGIVFVGNGEYYICLLPDNGIGANMHIHFLTPEQWEAVVRASDDPQYLDGLQKIWLRKAQRAISGLVQQQIWARDHFRCMYCMRPMGEVQLSVDHFYPLEMGGKDEPSNYISACRKCNKDKGKLPPEVYITRLKGRGMFSTVDAYIGYLRRRS